MILDGYNRAIRFTEGEETIQVVYRPATRSERDVYRWMWKNLSPDKSETSICEWMLQHIIESSFDKTIFSVSRLKGRVFQKVFFAIQGLIPDSSGETWAMTELSNQRNLYNGILLLRTNPKIANRDCEDCTKHWYNESTGEPIIENSTGKKMLRIAPPMCRTEIGCAKGSPENSKALNKSNRWAFEHYKRCKATGQFPDDEIVRGNAIIIEAALKAKVN